MKFQVTQPFIAFGMTCEPHQVVELTEEQAALLAGNDCVTPYETKVMPVPENKKKPKAKPSASSRPGRVARKKTVKRSRKPATK